MSRAPILARFVALVIDMAIVFFFSAMALVAALSGYYLGSGKLTFVDVFCILFISSILSCLIFLLYFTCLTAREGMTIGKRIMKVRVVAIRGNGTDKPGNPGVLRSLVRTVSYLLSAWVCFGGFLMAFFFNGRTLHDMIAGTEVVRCEDPWVGCSDHEKEIPDDKITSLQ